MTHGTRQMLAIEPRGAELVGRSREAHDAFVTGGAVEYLAEADRHRRAIVRTHHHVALLRRYGLLPDDVQIGASVLRNARSGARFVEVEWRRTSGTRTRHWLRILEERPAFEALDLPVSFVTGSCLFGKSGAIASLSSGARVSLTDPRTTLSSSITRLSVSRHLSAYEFDTACRLTSLIGAMGERLGRRARVFVHIPEPEYLLFVLARVPRQSHGVVRSWAAAVQDRARQVEALFRARFAREAADLEVTSGSPLSGATPYLIEQIERGRSVAVRDAVDAALRTADDALAEAFEACSAVGAAPSSLDELARLGYCAAVLAAARRDGSELAVEIENPTEEPIFRAARRVIRHQRRRCRGWGGGVLAIFPHEQVVNVEEGVLDSAREERRRLSDGLMRSISAQYD